jgi:DNA gyrase inhibitor GyrI
VNFRNFGVKEIRGGLYGFFNIPDHDTDLDNVICGKFSQHNANSLKKNMRPTHERA